METETGAVRLEDVLDARVISHLKVDAGQRRGFYFEISCDATADRYRKTLYRIDLESLESVKIELPFEPDDFLPWKEGVVLKCAEGGSTVFRFFDDRSGAVNELLTVPFAVQEFAFGDASLFFTAETRGGDTGTAVRAGSGFPFFQEGRGAAGESVKGLFGSGIDGKDIFLITAPDMDVEQVDFDIEGGRILFNAFAAGGVRPVESGLYLYDTGKKKLELLWDRRFRIGPIKLTAEHAAVFAGVDLEERSRNDNPRLYRLDLHSGSCAEFGSFADRSFEQPATATDAYFSGPASMKTRDGYLYFRQVERDREVLRRMDPDGKCETLFDGMKLLGGFEVLDGALLLTGLAGMKLSELYLFRDGTLRQLTGHNAAFAGKRFSEPERITERIDGTEIDGYLFPPAELQAGERYPAVLMIHGGPKMIYTGAWAHDIQLLCARGYYVLCVNPAGSDGRGDEFLDIRGRFAELPYRQLIAFTERVVARYPGIDRERLGVTGGSYGGYMTNYIISRTGLFKAAVSERSISSLVTAFTSSDIGYQFIHEYMGNRGAPWQSPGEALEASPLFGAGNVSTPTLFIHGTNDNRCHYSESLNMYGALKYHGVESRLCLFEGENHSLPVRGRPKNRLRRYMEMLDWFDGHLNAAAAGRERS